VVRVRVRPRSDVPSSGRHVDVSMAVAEVVAASTVENVNMTDAVY